MKNMTEYWEDYRQHVVDRGAGPVQLFETRKAFYAGAIALLGLLGAKMKVDVEVLYCALMASVYKEE